MVAKYGKDGIPWTHDGNGPTSTMATTTTGYRTPEPFVLEKYENASTVAPPSVPTGCPTGFTDLNPTQPDDYHGSCLKILHIKMNYTEATDICYGLGAELETLLFFQKHFLFRFFVFLFGFIFLFRF